MILLATDIIIDHLKCERSNKSLLLQLVESQPYTELGLSVISLQLLYSVKFTLREESKKDLLATLRVCKILPYTYEIAQTAGQLRRDLNQPLEFTTAAVAATAIVYQIPLYTQHSEDFSALPNIQLFN